MDTIIETNWFRMHRIDAAIHSSVSTFTKVTSIRTDYASKCVCWAPKKQQKYWNLKRELTAHIACNIWERKSEYQRWVWNGENFQAPKLMQANLSSFSTCSVHVPIDNNGLFDIKEICVLWGNKGAATRCKAQTHWNSFGMQRQCSSCNWMSLCVCRDECEYADKRTAPALAPATIMRFYNGWA